MFLFLVEIGVFLLGTEHGSVSTKTIKLDGVNCQGWFISVPSLSCYMLKEEYDIYFLFLFGQKKSEKTKLSKGMFV